jgi:hypothetical protein
MTRKATLRIEANGNPMEPMCAHVCADEKLIAIVSLEDFDNACEAASSARNGLQQWLFGFFVPRLTPIPYGSNNLSDALFNHPAPFMMLR